MEIGDSHVTAPLSVSRGEIIEFAKYWDSQPFHVSEEAAQKTSFEGLFGSGLQSICTMIKLGVDSGFLTRNAIAGVAMENLRYHYPLRPGMEVHSEFEVVEARPSRKQPERIIAKIKAVLVSSDGQRIVSADLINMYSRPPV